jgi:hypothetical protein
VIFGTTNQIFISIDYGLNWSSILITGENTICVGGPITDNNGNTGIEYFINSAIFGQNIIYKGQLYLNLIVTAPITIYTSTLISNDEIIVGYITASSKYNTSNNGYVYATANGPNLLISPNDGNSFTQYIYNNTLTLNILPLSNNVPITIQTNSTGQYIIIAYANNPTSTWFSYNYSGLNTTTGTYFSPVLLYTNQSLQYENTSPISTMNGYTFMATCAGPSSNNEESQIYIGVVHSIFLKLLHMKVFILLYIIVLHYQHMLIGHQLV